MTRMVRFHIVFGLLSSFLLLVTAPLAGQESRASLERQARDALPSVITQIDVERRLLDQDREAYRTARAQESEQRGRLELLVQEIDQLLDQESPDLDELLETQTALDSATLAAEQAGRQVAELRRAVVERLRRIALLEDDLRVLARATSPAPSPVSGLWEVEVQPAGVPTGAVGTFELDVSGSIVEGRYRLADGRSGVIRGTYGGLTLRLELLESTRGLDAIFEGRYDPDEETLQGFWQPTELGAGEAGGGAWSARKLDDEDIDLEELGGGA